MGLFGNTMKEAKFIAEFVIAAKTGDKAKLKKLLNKKVKCLKCKKSVEGIRTVTPEGGLRCPECGNDWMYYQ